MSWASQSKHIVLIRDPVKLISSWAGPTSPVGLEMTLDEVAHNLTAERCLMHVIPSF
jgi:hypothetical protein